MRLLVGLGNPGPQYQGHRHNFGRMAVEVLAHRHALDSWCTRFQGRVTKGRIGGVPVLVLLPDTFMNLSGQSVGEAVRFFRLDPEMVIVLYDDLDLPLGRMRVRRGGGAGGHNGLRSLDAHLGSEYWRLRLGIGHPGHRDLVTRHVLSDFSGPERLLATQIADTVATHFSTWLERDAATFANLVTLDLRAASLSEG